MQQQLQGAAKKIHRYKDTKILVRVSKITDAPLCCGHYMLKQKQIVCLSDWQLLTEEKLRMKMVALSFS